MGCSIMWYEWNSLEEFNEWHNSICNMLNIPNEYASSYTDVYNVENKWIAVVHDNESAGLNVTTLRPYQKDIDNAY